jgi:hypothetical protein
VNEISARLDISRGSAHHIVHDSLEFHKYLIFNKLIKIEGFNFTLPCKCFILIQLDVQYSFFLKSLLAQHVSDVTASIVRSTTVVYSHRFFMVFGVFIPWDWYWCWDTLSL